MTTTDDDRAGDARDNCPNVASDDAFFAGPSAL
jgi:hypothetical protein